MLHLLPGISPLLISALPVHSPAFFPKTFPMFFPVLAVANTGSCVGPQNKRGLPEIGSKTCVIVFLVSRSEIVDRI